MIYIIIPLQPSIFNYQSTNVRAGFEPTSPALLPTAIRQNRTAHKPAATICATAHRALIIRLNTQSLDFRKTMSNPVNGLRYKPSVPQITSRLSCDRCRMFDTTYTSAYVKTACHGYAVRKLHKLNFTPNQ